MYRYYKGIDSDKLIIRADKYVEKYDKTQKKWVKDWELLKIYTGDIPTDAITESEANRLIAQMK